jgi:hypothetical protein
MNAVMVANARRASPGRGAGRALATGALLCLVSAAAAQQPTDAGPATPSQQSAPGQIAAAATPAPEAGFFGPIGHWVGRSLARAGAIWKGEPEASSGDARESAFVGLWSKTRVVSGRERCQTAANGAPDCRTAIEALCRSSGFSAGESLDVQSAEKCPARVWISRAQATRGECRMESHVRRALCR